MSKEIANALLGHFHRRRAEESDRLNRRAEAEKSVARGYEAARSMSVAKEVVSIQDSVVRSKGKLVQSSLKMGNRDWNAGQRVTCKYRGSSKPGEVSFWSQPTALAPSSKERKKPDRSVPTLASLGGPSVSPEQFEKNVKHAQSCVDAKKKGRVSGETYEKGMLRPDLVVGKSAPIKQVSESSVPITPKGLIF